MNKSHSFRILFFSFMFMLSIPQSLKAHMYELGVISLFHNCGPHMKEWVKYHHKVGVEHFWLYDDASTDNWREELKTYIDKGIVEVISWPCGKPDWTPGQMNAFRDGLKHALGTAKWVSCLDQDEFIVPMEGASITKCIQKHFNEASAIFINWRNFGTSGVTLQPKEPMLPRLTRCSERNHGRNGVGKSIFRPECALIDEMWSQHHCPLKPGFTYVDGDGTQTLKAVGVDWRPDGKHHDRYIRINHYALGDEAYFWNVRIKRNGDVPLYHQLHDQLNATKDFKILDVIKKNFPDFYKEWK